MNFTLDIAELGRNMFPGEMLSSAILTNELRYCEERSWVKVEEVEEGKKALLLVHQHFDGSTKSGFYKHSETGALLHISERGESVHFSAASNNEADLEVLWKLFGVGKPAKDKPKKEKPTINVAFHTVKNTFIRSIEAPKWKGIEENYPQPTRGQLSGLMAGKYRPSQAGQLILWHGLPGTGKTFALRALGREWKKWGKLHYITDPDAFFATATYMLNLLLADNRPPWEEEMEEMEEDSEASNKNKGDGWKVIIAEDTGELLASDAKQQTGQGLSRLLNIVDGMIGQGLKVCVLITTNEELKNLHPAVTRPGRCGALINFSSFSVVEQEAWFKERGLVDVATNPKGMTLAEMYAVVEGRKGKRVAVDKRMGFGN